MKTKFPLSLFMATLMFAGCIDEPLPPPQLPVDEPAAVLDSLPRTRWLDTPYGEKPMMYSNTGSVINLPALEPGNVLYINKSYHFQYKPTTAPPSHSPRDIFVEASFRVGSAEITRSSQNPIEFDYIFTNPGTYRATGNTMYKVYNSAYVGEDGNTHYRYGEHYAAKVFSVIDLKEKLSISGQGNPSLNYNYSYTAETFPAVTFNSWSITSPTGAPGYSMTTNGTSMTIRFHATGQFTIKANYTLPGGLPYSVTKVVSTAVSRPNIWWDQSYMNDIVVVVQSPKTGDRYDWELNNWMIESQGSSRITIPEYHLSGGSNYVRCRSISGGYVSEWSDFLYISTYAPQEVPEETEDDDEISDENVTSEDGATSGDTASAK